MIAAGPGDPRWHALGRVGSTSDEAARLGREGAPAGTVVVAEAQDRGRGRLGHSWYSPPGESLYLSVLLRPDLPPRRAPLLTLCAGVAVADAVAEEAGGRGAVELKWPNDLLLSGPLDRGGAPRKVAGVLTEMVTTGARVDFVVVGIGVNLGCPAFPAELAGRATSLKLALGAAPSPAAFAVRLVWHLRRWYGAFLEEGPAPVLRRFCEHAAFLRRPGPLVVRGAAAEDLVGVPEGLGEDGALLLRAASGALHRVVAGEIGAPEGSAAP